MQIRKWILVLSVYALVPAVYIAVANADEEEYVDEYDEYEEYDDSEEYTETDSGFDAENVESRTVAERVTCADIKAEMDSLSGMDELSVDDAGRLDALKSDYRSKCTKKSGGRAIKRASIATTHVVKSQNVNVDGGTNGVCDTPDSNGCCPGETYTDLGDLGFNCCESDGVTCFPPMK
ncbi:MAG: hypothetical protein KBT14_04290 [Proteobacteria bacterium]|nr:hypothetical protein [Candidatus Enterousia onthequi]